MLVDFEEKIVQCLMKPQYSLRNYYYYVETKYKIERFAILQCSSSNAFRLKSAHVIKNHILNFPTVLVSRLKAVNMFWNIAIKPKST